MNCPRCHVSLKSQNYQSLPVEFCSTCGGLWLQQDEFSRVLQHHDKNYSTQFVRDTLRKAKTGISESEAKAIVPCPTCSQSMRPLNWSYNSGVIINVCASDGIWFDKNELEQIEAFYDAWEAKKQDIKEEYRASLTQIERDHWKRYDEMCKEINDKIFLRHGLFHWMAQLSTELEKNRR